MAPEIDVIWEGQLVAACDRVCDHMTRLFATTAPDDAVPELLQRSRATADPFLVVLDRLRRPQGIVYHLDSVAAGAVRAATGEYALYLDP